VRRFPLKSTWQKPVRGSLRLQLLLLLGLVLLTAEATQLELLQKALGSLKLTVAADFAAAAGDLLLLLQHAVYCCCI
jgi:hypothetical protein